MVEAGSQLIEKGKIDSWQKVGVSAIAGAATGGLSALGTRIVLGGAISVTEGYIHNKIDNENNNTNKSYTADKAVNDALIGAASGFAGHFAEKLVKSTSVVKAATKTAKTAAKVAKNHRNLGKYGRAAKRAEKKLERAIIKRTAPADIAISATAKAVSQNQEKK